jgi:hypothetical protein
MGNSDEAAGSACPTVACIHLADSVQKRKLNCHWRHRKKHRARGEPFILPMIIRGSESQAATSGLQLARWGLQVRSTFVLDYRNVVIRGLGEEHVIPTTAYSATTYSSTVQVDEIL